MTKQEGLRPPVCESCYRPLDWVAQEVTYQHVWFWDEEAGAYVEGDDDVVEALHPVHWDGKCYAPVEDVEGLGLPNDL